MITSNVYTSNVYLLLKKLRIENDRKNKEFLFISIKNII